ncbi:Antirepressor protein [Pseudomonas cichorii]|nr:Antirepressor protein [Pseudomonas cichorii]
MITDSRSQGFDMHPQLMPVPFYEDTVVLVGQGNEPFVAIKPIVTNMELDWHSQRTKINERFQATAVEITSVAEDGKLRGMTCLPLRKLPAWLYSISPNKVKPDLREKIIRYQEEYDDALWDYWTKGSASRPRSINVNQQLALSRHRVALLKELHKARDNGLRAALHEQIAQVSEQLGLSVPALNAIGVGSAGVEERSAPLWAALQRLQDLRVPFNHSKKPEQLLALHWASLNKAFAANGIPYFASRELQSIAKESHRPRYRDTRPTDSAIESKSIRCAVFKKQNITLVYIPKGSLMLDTDDLNAFLTKLNISEDEWNKSGASWDTLKAIASNYQSIAPDLKSCAEYVESRIRAIDGVHSVRWRIKDTDHLMEKIIRKNLTKMQTQNGKA